MIRTVLVALLMSAASANAATVAKPVEWSHEGTDFVGYLVYDKDADGKRPGILMVPNWMGANAAAVDKARAIAERGYVVLVADVYGKDVRPEDSKQASAAAGAMYADRPLLRARTQKALDMLRVNAADAPLDVDRIGAIGFCFGGATALELARSGADIDGVVTFHGALDTSMPAEAGQVKAPLLVLNGAADAYVTAEHIAGFQQEMHAAKADWVFVNFADAVHCFAEPDANAGPGCMYHERSAKRAYRMMDDFFAEAFAGD